MRSSHSKQKEDLIYRISLSRVRVLTETDKLANGMGVLPSMLRDACVGAVKTSRVMRLPSFSSAKSAAKSVAKSAAKSAVKYAPISLESSASVADTAPATAAAVSALSDDAAVEFYSPAEVAEKERVLLLLCVVVSTTSALCFLPSMRLFLARMLRSLLAYFLRSLRDVVTKVFIPSLITAMKGAFKTVFSLK